MYIYPIFFIHSSGDGHLGCFHVLAVVHTASLNIGIHVSFQMGVLVFWEYTLRSGIAGSYGSSFFFFQIYLFLPIYFWLSWVFVAEAFSDCGEQGLLFIVVPGLLIPVASLVADHGL